MVHFVGAGSGAVDLITVRGAKLLSEADVVIYAGSLVNPEHLSRCKAGCEIHDSAKLTLEEVLRDGFSKVKVPVLAGLQAGHMREMVTLPLGRTYRMDADKGSITLVD